MIVMAMMIMTDQRVSEKIQTLRQRAGNDPEGVEYDQYGRVKEYQEKKKTSWGW